MIKIYDNLKAKLDSDNLLTETEKTYILSALMLSIAEVSYAELEKEITRSRLAGVLLSREVMVSGLN